MRIRDLPKELGEPDHVVLADTLERMETPSLVLTRRLWERPARDLLHLLRGGRTEVHSPEAAALLGDLRAALEEIEIPERYC
jgi:hypothetical protein